MLPPAFPELVAFDKRGISIVRILDEVEVRRHRLPHPLINRR
jgi:predicted nuclease with RNAse H fold